MHHIKVKAKGITLI